MKNAYKNLRDCVFHNPLAISSLHPKLIRIAGSYLPYSTGMEIECDVNNLPYSHIYTRINRRFLSVGCMSSDVGSGECRIRIPKGVAGMVALYKSTRILKEEFGLNPSSGIHYHIDMTDAPDFTSGSRRMIWERMVIKELEDWDYKGYYNRKMVSYESKAHVWLNYKRYMRDTNSFTSEFRIGEMTFEYDILIKRIIHAQSLIKRVN